MYLIQYDYSIEGYFLLLSVHPLLHLRVLAKMDRLYKDVYLWPLYLQDQAMF